MKIKSTPFQLAILWTISITLIGYSFYTALHKDDANAFPVVVGIVLVAFSCYETWKWNKGVIIISNNELILGHRSGIEFLVECKAVSRIRFDGDSMFIDIGTAALKVPEIGISERSKDALINYFSNNRDFA